MPTHSNLAVELAGFPIANPVLLAAGTAGLLDEMGSVIDLSRIGGVVTKSITRAPREGNATWRILECGPGMLNAIGLANVGIEAFVRDVSPRIATMPTRVIGSVAGFSIDDYVHVAGEMDAIGTLAGIELNVSCPNVHGGTEFGVDGAALGELVRAVRAAVRRTPLFVKLSPVAVAAPGARLVDLARIAIEPPHGVPGGPSQRPGADGLTIANTMPAMAIDVRTRRPRLANVTGGLSGPAIHPIAVRLVHEVYRTAARDTRTPIIGVGGVLRWEDAAEFILAGATAVQIGTGLFADPRLPLTINRGLSRWVREQGVTTITELVGSVRIDG
jgi:dihydroorotate dehydrogenase (NAD+) catalytic subunit